MDKSDPSFADSHLSVHGGEDRNKYAQSLIPPIAQTSTFVFNGVEDFEGFKAASGVDMSMGATEIPLKEWQKKR